MTTNGVYALVVAPHPDDAEFGVAGTVAGWTSAGKPVVYATVTDGDKGTSDRNVEPRALAELRRKEQRAAAKVLGVSEVVFLGYPDQGVEETDAFRKDLVRVIRRFRPEIVVTADPYRKYIWHRDHRVTARVVLDAVFPYARDHLSYPDLLEQGYEPHKVKEVWCWGSEDPNYCSDISKTFHLKLAALRCHKSQVGDPPSPEMEKRIRQRCEIVADGKGFTLGEAFHRVEIGR